MSKQVEIIGDDYALIQGGAIIVAMGEPNNLFLPATEPRNPKPKDENTSSDVAYWGENNDFPQVVIAAVERSTELAPLLDWKARALQGREVLPFRKVWNAVDKKLEYLFVDDPEILEFLSDITFKRYMREAPIDFFWFWNVFPDLIKSADGQKIAYLGTHDASWCRWGKMDNKGVIKQCFVSANWPDAKPNDKTDTLQFPVVDPYSFNIVENLRSAKYERFVYPISYPSPGKAFYQLAPWNGFLVSGWAAIAASIPKGKEKMMNRVLSAKYILQIPISYWPSVYKDWDKLKPEERLPLKKAKVKEINDQLTGQDNAGKTILTEVGKNPVTGEDIPAWDIRPIENNQKEGENLEDSREASEHLMRALGVDPTLVGDGPGTKMGAGSGSDKRIAFNIYVALQQPYREVILEPLYFIAKYNGWADKYPGLCFKMQEIELETLDKSHQTSKETTK